MAIAPVATARTLQQLESWARLTPTGNGTYLADVVIDGSPVKLLVDTYSSGVWVKCSALGPMEECAKTTTRTSTSDRYDYLPRITRGVSTRPKRASRVRFVGREYTGFDLKVVLDELPELGNQAQGILGLRQRSSTYTTMPIYLDGQTLSVALALGSTTADSSIRLDGVDEAKIEREKLVPARITSSVYVSSSSSGDATMNCFQLPLKDMSLPAATGTFTVPSCDYNGAVWLDSAFSRIAINYATLDAMARRFLYACTRIGKEYYTCDKTVSLPRLTLPMGTHKFFLEPKDYTDADPTAPSSKIRVWLTDESPASVSWVLGSPFLRKYYSFFNGTSYLYCKEGTTCERAPASSNSYTSGGGVSGGGGGGGGVSGGGGGGGISIDFDGSHTSRRGRKKSWLTPVLASVGGGVFLACVAFMVKACKDDDKDDKTGAGADGVPEAVVVDVAMGIDDSDADDSDCSSNSSSDIALGASIAIAASPKRPKTSKKSSVPKDAPSGASYQELQTPVASAPPRSTRASF